VSEHPDTADAPLANPFKAIAAMASNRVIGRCGRLPWRLPDDLRWFKKTTLGHNVLMGRATWESLPVRPLPGRRNLVLSTTMPPGEAAGAEVVASTAALGALALAGETWVIGGEQVYRAMLPACVEVRLSYVFEPYPGDAYFPPFEDDFELAETLAIYPEFEVRRYLRKATTSDTGASI
jgi:dihydrofolate reductase